MKNTELIGLVRFGIGNGSTFFIVARQICLSLGIAQDIVLKNLFISVVCFDGKNSKENLEINSMQLFGPDRSRLPLC